LFVLLNDRDEDDDGLKRARGRERVKWIYGTRSGPRGKPTGRE